MHFLYAVGGVSVVRTAESQNVEEPIFCLTVVLSSGHKRPLTAVKTSQMYFFKLEIW